MEKHQFTFDEEDISLMEYANIFLGNTMWLENNKGMEETTFELTVRDQPKNWGYFVFYGLDRFLTYVKNFKFTDKQIKVLVEMNLVKKEHISFYKNFKFNGDILSIDEGTPFFAGEPILRMTGTMIETNLMTALVLNAFSYPTRVLTKITRQNIAAGKKRFSSAGSVRSQGFEQVLINLFACQIGGSMSSIQPISYYADASIPRNNLQANINHATISSFDNEREAISFAIKKILPHQPALQIMVDTYDMKKGLAILIDELKKTTFENQKKIWVPIDSGNVYETAKHMRKELDKNGLSCVHIMAFSNLNEYRIDKLEKKKAPIDFYIGVTEVINVTDAPVLEAVYKMSEVRQNGIITNKAKLTKGKESYPGRKQIFRNYDKKGIMSYDIIGFEDEKLGEPLLKKYVKNGVRIKKQKTLLQTKTLIEKNLLVLPKYTKEIYAKKKYPVKVSTDIKKIVKQLKKKHQ
jgi:nicotinate phosphoribosyltransferase